MNNLPLSRTERLRRVATLCLSFTRNLAYYRLAQNKYKTFLKSGRTEAIFWVTANANSYDICILEWYKLFIDKNGKHHWKNIVSDSAHFEAGLLEELGINAQDFQITINELQRLRDKFLAHLDSDRVIDLPRLDIPKKAVWYYYCYLLQHEGLDAEAERLHKKLEPGYKQAEHQADMAYRAVIGEAAY